MQVVFLGTAKFALPSLKALHEGADYQVTGVITQPDRPAGRGHRLTFAPVKSMAQQFAIPLFQSERVRDDPKALEFLQERRCELIVLVAFGQILPPEFFNYPPFGTFNVHASLLPRYRGAAPLEHALIHGETETGVTVMKLDESLDTGDILSQTTLPISENITAGELEHELAYTGANLLLKTITAYASGQIKPRPQDHNRATYASRIQKEQARINWTRCGEEIHNWIRALNPRPVAFAVFRGERVRVWRSEKVSPGDQVGSARHPGEVLEFNQARIVVRCGEGSLLALKQLQLSNRNRVSAFDFANGVGLRVGERFA